MRNGKRYFALFVLYFTCGVLARVYASDGEAVTTTDTPSTVIFQTADNGTISDEHVESSTTTSTDGREDDRTVPSASSTETTDTLDPETTDTLPESSSEEEYANEKATSSNEALKGLGSEIRDLMGKPMDFSYMIAFTEGAQLTLANSSVDLSAFTIDETNVFYLDKMLHGRDIPELLYVACRLAGIEARKAKMKGETPPTLALEDIFDQTDDNDVILRTGDVDDLVEEITEDPSILNLDPTSESSAPVRDKRKAKAHSSHRWPGTIPYIISRAFRRDASTRRAIESGIQHWRDETCLQFRKVTSYRGPYIIFKKGSGCSSSIGMVNNKKGQRISIGRNCGKKAIVVHEIGHAIGFWHEHQRPDRDGYVKIYKNNIKSVTKEINFLKRKWEEVFTMGIPYDYSSIMHYPFYYFSKNKNLYNTLTAKDAEMNSVVGQRVGLSFYDVKLANLMYCKDKCSGGLAWSSCRNDGYRDPKDCSSCKCPDGWTGRYCTDVKKPGVNDNCGTTSLTASSSWKTLKSLNYGTANSECTWRIKATGKYTIRLKFTGTFDFPCSLKGRGACVDFIEVRYKDMVKAGPRFCCSKRPTQELVSHGNEMLLLLRATSGFRTEGFSLQYRLESCGGCSAAASSQSAPACVDTQTYSCNATYSDCSRRPCVTRYRHNTCYKEVKTCCDDFKLIGSTFCYRHLSVWSGWSNCSKSCGYGYRKRWRSCLRAPCSGSTMGYISCSGTSCSGLWSSWYSWSSCSKTCGPGFRTRRRSCLRSPCGGPATYQQTCTQRACPKTKRCSYKARCGGWWFWTKYCTRYRTC